MSDTKIGIDLRYSGLESDQFVALARKIIDLKSPILVTVEGREPITSVQARIVGTPIATVFEGYRRTLRIETSRGQIFDVGGSNTTKSVASEKVTFHAVPSSVVPAWATRESLNSWLKELEIPEVAQAALDAISAGLRASFFEETECVAILSALSLPARSRNPDVRSAAVGVIAQIGGEDALGYLSDALVDPEDRVRRQAALRLRGVESLIRVSKNLEKARKCVDALALALARDSDEQVRIYAAEDLGYFYNEGAQTALRHALSADKSHDVRWACAVAIGRSNDPQAVQLLRGVLDTEDSPSIRKAAYLGIGRHASDLVLRDNDAARSVVADLAKVIELGDSAGRDYAIHALGEFGDPAAPYFESLFEVIKSKELEVLSCAVMTVAKLMPFTTGTPDARGKVLTHLRLHLSISEPTSWPELGFFRSFLATAGDLALKLEDFDLARRFYEMASASYADVEWLKLFYQGAQAYAEAEAAIARNGDLTTAKSEFAKAIEWLAAVESNASFGHVDAGRSGLRLKQILAQARLAVISALALWRPYFLDIHDLNLIRGHLRQAGELYRRLDLTNLTDSERKLAPQEVALVSCLQLMVNVLDELCHLAESVISHDGDKVRFAVGAVRVQARRLCAQIRTTGSPSLERVERAVGQLLEAPHASAALDAEMASELMDRLPSALLSAVPAPGTCPIVTFGEAGLTLRLVDSTGGAGTRADPLIIEDRFRVIFDAEVEVRHRTKDDELIFTADGPIEARGNAVQYVPVHEGIYALRPIDFGKHSPSSVPLPFSFLLSFRNRGCMQQVAQHEIWVRTFDSEGDRPIDKAKRRDELALAEVELMELERQASDYQNKEGFGFRLRQIEDEIDAKRAYISRIRKLT